MDAKSTGITISTLRKRLGLTQAALAEKLNVSDKTVSKWESGNGYPEITQFPVLAEIFGVTVDYLITGERRGIILAGNILADIVKRIDCYPKMGMLSNILSVSRAVGGCVPNVGIDLAKIDRSIPITAMGRIGDDEYGRYTVSKMQKYGIDTSRVAVSANTPTSFTDVMSEPSGERTFFHSRGANAEFSPEDVDLNGIDASILHIGYIFLLDYFDGDDGEYGTVMARFLHDVQARGIKTSIDVVSDSSADYKNKILPSLKHSDYAIMNEIESCNIYGLDPYGADGKIKIDVIKETAIRMAEAGVSEKVIIHAKEAGFCYNCITKEFTAVPSLKIPKELIKGSVGAGDAFCAGCLYGIYNGLSDEETLRFASSAAACNLFSENSVDGMLEKNEIVRMEEKFGRIAL